jgi:SNF family Na+-dependent transporter
MSNSNSQQWGSRVGLILAMAGNAVGLGNFLRFPVQAVQNGGGAFIIPYLICFVLMGIPLLWIEWSMGRFGGRHGHHSTPFILDSMNKRAIWKYIGVFGIFTNIGVAAYYCYIESWTMSYMFHSIARTFEGMSQSDVAGFFAKYVDISQSTTGIPYESVIFYVFCLALNTYILSRGLDGVEKVAKIGMPLLILFGVFLAIRGLTLGTSGASPEVPNASAWDGLNFLWTPQYDSLTNPKVWLAAAGQIFFTLSVGMGTIQCYASYLKANDDVALNGASAGFTNEFVEVVLGSSIVIPIAAGYLGLDWVKENAGFGMAFQTMPFLFEKWGPVLAVAAGVMWFGLLFFAGITSSLAMGTPWMGFMRDEFKWGQTKGAISFGLITLLVGWPTVFFFNQGVFDEYDYWAGTVSLVVFATVEVILFSWIFGITKGWAEINQGADMKIPGIYKYILAYVTPVLLIFVFMGALVTPKNNDWNGQITSLSSGNGWTLDNSSIIKQITNAGLYEKITTHEQAISFVEKFPEGDTTTHNFHELSAEIRHSLTSTKADTAALNTQVLRTTALPELTKTVETTKERIYYVNVSRMILVGLFLFISILVYIAHNNRMKQRNAL